MNIWVLIVLFFVDNTQLAAAHVEFPTEQQCKLGQQQAKLDFEPIQVTTLCTRVKAPEGYKHDNKPKSQSKQST